MTVKRQGGFSLIELMVAMLIGLVIILGAGQLLLTVFTTRERVETIGEKQAAINFAVESIVRDMRRADSFDTPEKDGNDSLEITLPSDNECSGGLVREYWVEEKRSSGFYLIVDESCPGGASPPPEELVGGFSDSEPFVVEEGEQAGLKDGNDYGVKVTFKLKSTDREGEPDSFSFYAINRSKVVQDVFENNEPDENGNGNGNGNVVCSGPPWGAGGKPDECK